MNRKNVRAMMENVRLWSTSGIAAELREGKKREAAAERRAEWIKFKKRQELEKLLLERLEARRKK